MPDDRPDVTDVTDSSAVVTWEQIDDVPSGLEKYYEYEMEYTQRLGSSSWSAWSVWETYSHHSSADTQQDTLTGLTFNTDYRVRMKSYRVQDRSNREETLTTSYREFSTSCKGVPSYSIFTTFHKGITCQLDGIAIIIIR